MTYVFLLSTSLAPLRSPAPTSSLALPLRNSLPSLLATGAQRLVSQGTHPLPAEVDGKAPFLSPVGAALGLQFAGLNALTGFFPLEVDVSAAESEPDKECEGCSWETASSGRCKNNQRWAKLTPGVTHLKPRMLPQRLGVSR